MSGLAAVLSGRRAPGVHRWPAGGTAREDAAVRHAVEQAGWRFAVLSPGAPDLDALHTSLASALRLPAHYGRNLDALHDVLRDLDRPTTLLWEGWGLLAVEHPRAFRRVVRVLDAGGGDDAPGLEVLLPGPAPDLPEVEAVPVLA